MLRKLILILSSVLVYASLAGCEYMGGDLTTKDVPSYGSGLSSDETTTTYLLYSSSCSTHTGSATLYWEPPTTFSDGSSLAQSDINGYHLYYGTSVGIYSLGDYLISDPAATTLNTLSLSSVATGTYYFALSAVYVAGGESSLSNEVCKVISN